MRQQTLEFKKSVDIAEETYRTLFEHAATAVAVVGNDGILGMINRKFASFLGGKKAEIEGRLSLLDFFKDQDRILLRENLQKCRACDKKDDYSFECLFYGVEQKPKNVYLSLSYIPQSGHCMISMIDVTELYQLQSRLARSEQLAAIGELAASIAHEIRNPLGAINTSVEVLRTGLHLSGDDCDLMEIIREETQRLDRIVTDFLQFARLNRVRFRQIDINRIIRDTLLLLKGVLPSELALTVALDENLCYTFGDADQLRQVMINMIVNATEAVPKLGGQLTIMTKCVEDDSSKSSIQIIIQDNGQGIEHKNLEKVFKPFFSTKEKGVGMGLAICERIVHNHGGEMTVTSRIGYGASFSIILPIIRTAPEEEQ